ncbi:MAG: MarR family transcriptional regulator [Gemmatimonadetes bacterium]|nr:MAG: MarR family transcriptional regulator [Gemmatimonadota bacterium]
MAQAASPQRVAAVRRFNRFYTRQIGLLQETLLRSPFSLTEARVLYELGRHAPTHATALGQELGLDAGYLSRILRGFERRGLLERTPSKTDGRQSVLALTAQGRNAFARLDGASRREIGTLLEQLPVTHQARLVASMHAIEQLLDAPPSSRREPAYRVRRHRPGDMGWVVHRHGVLYAREYGWDARFEALVAEIVAKFIKRYDPKRERCWIAELEGEIVGSVFLVHRSHRIAQLRLLLVEPSARGRGIGARLVHECVGFARRAGYGKIMLWTNDVLHAARHLYEKAGFHLVREERHHSFGHDLVGQTWERTV